MTASGSCACAWPPQRPPCWCVALVAVAYIGVCRPAALLRSPEGRARRVRRALRCGTDDRRRACSPVSGAARAGLRTGDRITRANGQAIEGRLDWQRAGVHIDPSRPLDLDDRARGDRVYGVRAADGRPSRIAVRVAAPGLLAFRFAQLVTLALAILVAVRRAAQPSALLGAWLLARDRHGVDRAADAPGRVLARAAARPARR